MEVPRAWGTVERTFKAFCGTKPGAGGLGGGWVVWEVRGQVISYPFFEKINRVWGKTNNWDSS